MDVYACPALCCLAMCCLLPRPMPKGFMFHAHVPCRHGFMLMCHVHFSRIRVCMGGGGGCAHTLVAALQGEQRARGSRWEPPTTGRSMATPSITRWPVCARLQIPFHGSIRPSVHPSIRPSVPSLTHCFRWPLRKYERQSVQFVPCYFHVPLRFDSSKIGCGLRMHASRNLRRRIHPLASHERRRVAKRTGLLPLPLSVQSCVSQCRAVCRSAGHCRAESTYGCANLRRPCCHMSTYIHTRAHAGATSTLEKAKQHQSRN
jgi:hypothetical protein